MDHIETANSLSDHRIDRETLASHLLNASSDQWSQLGLYQIFHQELFKTCLSIRYLSEPVKRPGESETESDDKPEGNADGLSEGQVAQTDLSPRCERDQLITTVSNALDPLERRLFSATAPQLIDELINADWLATEEGEVDISDRRFRQLSDQVEVTEGSEFTIKMMKPTLSQADQRAQELKTQEAKRIAKREERLRESSQYINPLDHISHENETPFTIRRLDLILTSLDGLVLRQESFRSLLKMSVEEYELVFSSTDRLGLTHRSDDGYIRLDFYGSSIARQAREPRLKTLAMMASRLRREERLRTQVQLEDAGDSVGDSAGDSAGDSVGDIDEPHLNED